MITLAIILDELSVHKDRYGIIQQENNLRTVRTECVLCHLIEKHYLSRQN